ncbi:permease-like cell division protein FtsX [Micromonospora mirobrigensis]|uniref:FtsX extracellular domain-containing protein n=1 Tax=Micromonospora mirobrigensis TaxID=262898 RepID=A0A1C4Y8W8_9ACTN|nr:permease-like cell division protein FtsX [Micromonospora mirobrigensis]SCF17154.1 hypothetical protein GA0070564_103633 [Micromonospora mirobrigensis]
MSSRIREALVELEGDVSGLRLAPPAAVRARGRARTRRRVGALAGATAVVLGAAALPVWRMPADPPTAVAGDPRPSPTCAPEQPPQPGVLMVFFKQEVTDEQRRAVLVRLKEFHQIDRAVTVSPVDRWERFVATHCGSPDLARIGPDQFPDSVEVHLRRTDPAVLARIREAVRTLPGVDEVPPPAR